MSARSPRSPASAGSRSRPARPGRPSRRCWSRRGCPARSTTACSAAWTARALAGRRGSPRQPWTRPAPGGCRAGRGPPAGVRPTRRPAWGKGAGPAGGERAGGTAEEGPGSAVGGGGPTLLSWDRGQQSTDGPEGVGAGETTATALLPLGACEGHHPVQVGRAAVEGPRHTQGRSTGPWPRRRGWAPRHLPSRPRGGPCGALPHPLQPRVATMGICDLPEKLSFGQHFICLGREHLSGFAGTVSGLGIVSSFLKPLVPSTACHRVPGTRLACPTLRRVPPSAGTRGSAPEPARSSPCGHRVGAAWAALPRGARHPAQGPVLLRLARPPFGEAACHPTPLLAAPRLAPAGRQTAGVGGSAQHTVAPPRAPGSAQAVGGEGWQAGLGAGRRSLAEPLPQRRPAGLTGGVSGACRPPEARSAHPESGALARRDRSCSPPPSHPALGRCPSSSRPPRPTVPPAQPRGRAWLPPPGCWGLDLPLGLGHRGKGSL